MRSFAQDNKLSVNAIAGSHVVLLGMNVEQDKIDKLLGFAIKCKNNSSGETYWLPGIKTFEDVLPNPKPGELQSSNKHPIQAFIWGDYFVEPDNEYIFTIHPVYGKPTDFSLADGVSVIIKTMKTIGEKHTIFFNRGNTASQAFSRVFGDTPMNEIPNEQFLPWLSRGLFEAMSAFIKQAKSAEYSLRAAVYEFNYEPVLELFKEAIKNNVDTKIIFDAKKDDIREKTTAVIKNHKLENFVIARKKGKSYISHNKFIVLLKDGEAKEVWTGSTNFTKSGIFGQSNVGHVIRDEEIAKKYLGYWDKLAEDPESIDFVKWNYNHTPFPKDFALPKENCCSVIFSPNKTKNDDNKTIDALDWYAQLMDKAKSSVCLTAAFGISEQVADIFKKDKDYLRYLLLDKDDEDVELIKRDYDNRIAVASNIRKTKYGRMLEERALLSSFVKFIHTKYLLIDPLSDDPIVITGSGNFSMNSARYNDENMVVIRGNTDVADVYLCEFMRLFNHYYFRQIYNSQRILKEKFSIKKYIWGKNYKKFAYLKPDNSWCTKYYIDGSIRQKERLLFGSKIN